jgi:uncharacterized protein
MHPDLVKLLELQAKDVALLEADRRLDAVLADAEALDQQLADARKAAEQAHRAVADATKRRQEVEAKIDNYKKLEDRGKARLDQVKTQKEMQAVSTELDLARQVLSKEEADWVKLTDQVAGLEAAASEVDKRLAGLMAGQKEARDEIALRQSAAEGKRVEALTARDDAAGEVERTLRTRYERLRTVKSVSVVVALNGPGCGACFTQVPLNRRTQIRAGTLIDSCESCGVILYAEEVVE